VIGHNGGMAAPRRRVLLLFGGQSAEHDVSRVTAVAVAAALDPSKYDIVPVGITTEGHWQLASDAQRMLEGARDALPSAFEVSGDLVPLPTATSRGAIGEVDVVLPLLHGPYGEDGTVQGLLELAGLPYVGSGVLGSAIGMDKFAMKRMFIAAGLPVGPFMAVREGDSLTAVYRDATFPCFVKPCNMGSSVGVSKAHDLDELREAIDRAFEYDEWILIEEMIPGREIELAVLGDRELTVSVPGEVIPGAEFYTYADKYEDGIAKLLIPAPLSPDETEHAQALAAAAFNACRCEAMARVDLFYDEAEHGFVVNEVNTIPGFTPISMYPRLMEASGVPYSELLDRLIDLAIEREQRRQSRRGNQR
jgi:D-alanine-D-alanine ligase